MSSALVKAPVYPKWFAMLVCHILGAGKSYFVSVRNPP